jgi:hypothetical protein
LDAILTPHFRPIARYCLPAPVPDRIDLVERFYIFVGQLPGASGLPPFAPAADSDGEIAIRRTLPIATANSGYRLCRPEEAYGPVGWRHLDDSEIATNAAPFADPAGLPDIDGLFGPWLQDCEPRSIVIVDDAPTTVVPLGGQTFMSLSQAHCAGDQSFDVVACPRALQHAAEPVELLRSILRIARRRVLLGIPSGNATSLRANLVYDPAHDRLFISSNDGAMPFNVLSRDDIVGLLTSVGISGYCIEGDLPASAKTAAIASVRCEIGR